MDYGAIGAVIGHEISHSFDDQGALFDATGKLENWWTQGGLRALPGVGRGSSRSSTTRTSRSRTSRVNGKLTLGENIADVAGLAAAYDAYRLSLGGKEAPTSQGLTGDQQFFVALRAGWRSKYREPALRRRILTDGHAPGEYRADTVRNLDAWYPAFDVKAGEKLYLRARPARARSGRAQSPTRSLGGSDRPKPSCSARTASSAYLRAITHEILISLVEISWMLMLSAASSWNIVFAMPACERMPTPTTRDLADLVVVADALAALADELGTFSLRISTARLRSPLGTVNVRSVVPS